MYPLLGILNKNLRKPTLRGNLDWNGEGREC